MKFVVIGGLAARAHGSTRITEDLDICYDTSRANVRRLTRLLAGWNAYRGVEPGLPFIMDERSLLATPVMALIAEQGEIDVFNVVSGVNGYASALADQIPELEALLELRKRG